METPEAERMKVIVAANAPLLKRAGFHKRRHCFNRTTCAGLVHVVNFWQAPKEPPAWTDVPGLRERLYGTFRVDFGVYIPEITRTGTPRSAWVNEYNCHIRATIGDLLGETNDLWWPLADPEAERLAQSALTDHGLPWLDRFADHDEVLRTFRSTEPTSMGMTPAGGLDVADMLQALGRTREARTILEAYVSRPVVPGHAEYLADYLARTGHNDLTTRIRTTRPS